MLCIHICTQEPWEAQEYAHRDRSRVKFSFCGPPGVETRLELYHCTTLVHVTKSTKSHSGPLQPRPRRTHLRVAAQCAACSLACFHLFFASCPLARGLVRRSRFCSLLIQLEAASFCRRSASPSPLRGHACCSLNASAQRTRVRLVPGSMPAHADPCGDNVSFTG